MSTITFVTGNAGKLREVRAILSSFEDAAGGEKAADNDTKISSLIEARDIDLPEIQGSPDEVAIEKCKLAATTVGSAVIVEDTSLCMNALNGMPGPFIKFFKDKIGTDGLPRILADYDDKTAYGLCTIAYSSGPGAEPVLFRGKCDGTIVKARGPPNAFGWDPVFVPAEQPDNGTLTFAEMYKDVKNSLSHRGRATRMLAEYLLEHKEEICQHLKKRTKKE